MSILAIPDAARMSGVSFSYKEEPVLRNASLEVPFGEVTLLVGENGSGKSTLMRLLLGELRPTAGSIEVLGREVSELSAREWENVGYVPQAAASSLREFPATVEELVAASALGRRAQARARAADALKAQRVSGLRKHLLCELSGGQLQKVLLARAAVNGPRLYLLDEPTSGLDRDAAAEVASFAAEQAKAGAAVLMITHDVARLQRVGPARRVLQLENGVVSHA